MLIAVFQQARQRNQTHLWAGQQGVYIQQGVLQRAIAAKSVFVMAGSQPGPAFVNTFGCMHITKQDLQLADGDQPV